MVLKIKFEKSVTAGNVLEKSICAPPVERSSCNINPKNKDRTGIRINIIF